MSLETDYPLGNTLLTLSDLLLKYQDKKLKQKALEQERELQERNLRSALMSELLKNYNVIVNEPLVAQTQPKPSLVAGQLLEPQQQTQPTQPVKLTQVLEPNENMVLQSPQMYKSLTETITPKITSRPINMEEMVKFILEGKSPQGELQLDRNVRTTSYTMVPFPEDQNLRNTALKIWGYVPETISLYDLSRLTGYLLRAETLNLGRERKDLSEKMLELRKNLAENKLNLDTLNTLLNTLEQQYDVTKGLTQETFTKSSEDLFTNTANKNIRMLNLISEQLKQKIGQPNQKQNTTQQPNVDKKTLFNTQQPNVNKEDKSVILNKIKTGEYIVDKKRGVVVDKQGNIKAKIE